MTDLSAGLDIFINNSSIVRDIPRLFIFFGGALSLLQSIQPLMQQQGRLRNILLFIIDACVGIILLQQYYLVAYSRLVPDLSLRPITWVKFIVGPSAYLFYMLVFTPGFRMSRKTLFHFIPALLAVVFSCLIFAAPMTDSGLLKETVNALQASRFLEFFHFSSLVILLIYVIVLFSRFRLYTVVTKKITGEQYRQAFILMVIFIMTLVLLISGIVLRKGAIITAAFVLLSFHVMYRFIAMQNHPGLLQDVSRAVRKNSYERSIMHGIDMNTLTARLMELMEEDRIYCDEDLTLRRLARLLSISTHQLSEFLNNHLKENFNSFVNRYRIEEAKELMQAHPGRPLLSIAFGVGFNTRSVFYDAFTKYTGMSPARYRKNLES